MTVNSSVTPTSTDGRPVTVVLPFGNGVWLLPVFGGLTLWATLRHQPDPAAEFSAWARFVSTDAFDDVYGSPRWSP